MEEIPQADLSKVLGRLSTANRFPDQYPVGLNQSSCTCPSDEAPVPCQHKYALTDCLQAVLDANIFRVGDIGFEAWEDRILVIEDPFRSGYECGVCNAKGQVVCDGCNGTGHSVLRSDARCSKCNGGGSMTCPECHGKGVLLVIPEASERRPTTGRIVSVGPKVRELRREQSVLYADYVGHLMDLSYENQEGRKIDCCLRVLRESEILAKISGGHLELRRLRRKVNMNEHGQ